VDLWTELRFVAPPPKWLGGAKSTNVQGLNRCSELQLWDKGICTRSGGTTPDPPPMRCCICTGRTPSRYKCAIPTFILGGNSPRYECSDICTVAWTNPVEMYTSRPLPSTQHLENNPTSSLYFHLPLLYFFSSNSSLSLSYLPSQASGRPERRRRGLPAPRQGQHGLTTPNNRYKWGLQTDTNYRFTSSDWVPNLIAREIKDNLTTWESWKCNVLTSAGDPITLHVEERNTVKGR
jgi:hypothetical protein